MKRLHRYLIQSFFGPLILTFFIVLFIMIMQFLWVYIDDLVGKGLTFKTIGYLVFYFSMSFVPMAMPLAVLLASLMTFGNMGENFELTAIKSSGVSLQKLMSPLVVVVLVISLFILYFSNNILPITNLRSRTLLYDIQRQRPEFNIKVGQFYNGIEGYSIKIGDKNYKTNLLIRLLIYDHTQKSGNVSVTYADSGYMKMTPDETSLIITLYHGYSYLELNNQEKKNKKNDKSYPERKDWFERETVVLPMTGFGLNRTDESLFKNNYTMLNLGQLQYATDSLKQILTKRKQIFIKTVYKTQLLSIVPKIKKFYADTISKKNRERLDSLPFNSQKILSSLKQQEQETAIERAQMMARTTKNFITTTKNTVLTREKFIRRHQIEWHRKFTLPVACLIFFFIGAPLGAIIRKGGLGLPIVISVLFFLVYHIISMIGEKSVREGMLTPFTGMWLSSFILLPVGIFLTYKATSDSAIMNTDTYLEFPRKIMSWLSGKQKSQTKRGKTTHEGSSTL